MAGKLGVLLVLVAAACGGGGERADTSSDGRRTTTTTERRSPDEQALDRLTPEAYTTTVSCFAAKQGIYPKAIGTLTNKSRNRTFFHVYLEWRRGGALVDLNVTYTGNIAPGETGAWDTFTPVKDADSCAVVCVDRQHPTDPNKLENCGVLRDALRQPRQR